jgi:hypothetical protein
VLHDFFFFLIIIFKGSHTNNHIRNYIGTYHIISKVQSLLYRYQRCFTYFRVDNAVAGTDHMYFSVFHNKQLI